MVEPPIRCEDYVRIRLGGWCLWMYKDLESLSATVLDAGRKLDGVRGPFQRIPSSEHTRVFKGSLNLAGRVHHFYIKQYLYRSPRDFVKHLFRPSRAMRSFKATLLLARNGFSAPEVIALGEDRRGPIRLRTFVITCAADEASSVNALFVADLSRRGRAVMMEKRRFITALGEIIGRMHAIGVFHGDLRLGNVLAGKRDNTWRFCFLDNERTRKFRRLPARLRLKNLVQLNMLRTLCITNTDRMRFFKAYLSQNPDLLARKRFWHKKTVRRTDRRLSRVSAVPASSE